MFLTKINIKKRYDKKKNVFVLKNSANEDDFYWEINYGMAQRCTSGIIDYKCKIIEDKLEIT